MQTGPASIEIKGTVSSEYINRKLFSKADMDHHKILILLKGHFTIYKNQSRIFTAQQFQMVSMILDATYIVCSVY